MINIVVAVLAGLLFLAAMVGAGALGAVFVLAWRSSGRWDR